VLRPAFEWLRVHRVIPLSSAISVNVPMRSFSGGPLGTCLYINEFRTPLRRRLTRTWAFPAPLVSSS
jgi:hypothetical protein